jgi:hypothetical protein
MQPAQSKSLLIPIPARQATSSVAVGFQKIGIIGG